MLHPTPRRQMPTGLLIRWLVLCPPLGLYYLWRRQRRWRWPRKLAYSLASLMMVALLIAGVLGILSNPAPVVAQSNAALLLQRDIYPLVADPQGKQYHLEGCIHTPKNAVPITLRTAAQRQMPPDELCNPPRYDSRN